MKTLNASLILQKNKLYQKDPWIRLFQIEIDDDTTIYRAAYPEDVPWNGITWTATPMIMESETQESSGRLNDVSIHVGNVTQEISAWVENNDILGNEVVIYFPSAADLSITTSVLSTTYRVNSIKVTDQVATFELGHDDLFSIQLPHQRFVREKCRFVYGPDWIAGGGDPSDNYCAYPGDEFNPTTKQDFVVGGDVVKADGWTAVNTAYADAMDVSVTFDGLLKLATDDTAAREWNDTDVDGPYIYKSITGNFDLYTRHTHTSTTDGGGGILLQSPADETDWFALMGYYSGTSRVYTRSTVNGTSSDTDEASYKTDLRVVRRGQDIIAYAKASTTDDWGTALSTTLRTDFPAKLRVGLFTYSRTAYLWITYFEYFRFYSGGLATCDHTLEGGSGCRAHENTLNFGGFPGIPVGRINV